MPDLHVVLGSGPVGSWIANTLSERGHRVRAVNRSGRRPELVPGSVQMLAADLSDQRQAVEAAVGASVVYQALNPSYDQWHRLFPTLQTNAVAAARSAGARYVSIENLYVYDASSVPITEATRIAPVSRKGELRARMADELWALHERGDLEVIALRSSDYYGPGVVQSALGERVFAPILAGKPGEALGSFDTPHSYAYIQDVGRAAATLGVTPAAYGRAWIAPHAAPVTQREVLDLIFACAQRAPRYSLVTPAKLKLASTFSPVIREMIEMMYEFTAPFTVDSTAFETAFAVRPTSIEDGLSRTVEWYRSRAGGR